MRLRRRWKGRVSYEPEFSGEFSTYSEYEPDRDCAMRPGGSVLQTRGHAALLTWKQAEMLVALIDGAQTTREISDLATELLNADQAMGIRPMYWGVDDGSIRQCLNGLQYRGLTRFDGAKWRLTPQGREAAESVR